MFWIPSQREAVYIGQESVTIECHSEAYPKSINYWVNHKGAMLQSSMISCWLGTCWNITVLDDKHEIVTVDTGYKVYMKLHIRDVEKSDIVEYRCVAKNSLGHSDGSISLYGKIIHRKLFDSCQYFRNWASHSSHNINFVNINHNWAQPVWEYFRRKKEKRWENNFIQEDLSNMAP